ncbi:hypothetical protein THAR02_03044 [Trichoderma harzianum]|uniref:Uncharacterized protein n=1 Tax=Trichoderma harzianum TaxID=5544 RepID=A0A0F9XJ04_TRIHA|nr:hypothetical protein THAR02_03044 [Trichoderma harzianum]
MSQSPKFHARAGSRASLASVGQMPVINEDSNAVPMSTSPTTPPPAILRVPTKNPRRSMGPPAGGPIIPYVIGFQDMPPGVLTPAECKDEGDDGDEDTVVGQMTPTPPSGSGYVISSSNDPIVSSFSNIPLNLLDGGNEDERVTFSFTLDVTFEPPVTATNRAARCTYTDTTYEATLWTKRGAQQPYNSVQKRMVYGNWTGLVEISEKKNATLGVPQCVDSQGIVIADVQAEMGTWSGSLNF